MIGYECSFNVPSVNSMLSIIVNRLAGIKMYGDALSNSRRNVCMRDYQKAFDSVSHPCLIEVLKLASTLQ